MLEPGNQAVSNAIGQPRREKARAGILDAGERDVDEFQRRAAGSRPMRVRPGHRLPHDLPDLSGRGASAASHREPDTRRSKNGGHTGACGARAHTGPRPSQPLPSGAGLQPGWARSCGPRRGSPARITGRLFSRGFYGLGSEAVTPVLNTR